jgi:hypothetical protein
MNMMNITARSLLGSITISLLLMTQACAIRQTPTKLRSEDVKRLLLSIEPWPSHSTSYSEGNWRRLVSVAATLQANDAKATSEALGNFQRSYAEEPSADENDGKLFLLMRIVFELPESSPSWVPRASFGGWLTGGTDRNRDGTINFAWPVRLNQGRPTLASGYLGLQGLNAQYDAAAEFAHFRSTYPLRNLKGVKP